MPSSYVLRAVLVASALAWVPAAGPRAATAQLLPTDPTTTTTAPVTSTPTTVAVTTTTAAPATTSTAATTTLAPTTTRPAGGTTSTTTTTAPPATTTLPQATDSPAGVPDPAAEAPAPSLPPLSHGGGTRVNWAALISLAGFGIALAMLALPGILQRRQLHQKHGKAGAR